MKKNLFVADGNWYLHRVYYTVNPKVHSVENAIVYSMMMLICRDALCTGSSYVLVGFDGSEVFRYSLYPEYKANRSESASKAPIREGFKGVYEYLPAVQRALTDAGIAWIQPRTMEADDVLCSAAFRFKTQVNRIFCGTKDKDAYQLVGDNVFLYDSSRKVGGRFVPRIITPEEVEKTKGLPSSKMVAYQCLIGDAIDNIPHVVGPATAKKILLTCGSISNALKSKDYRGKLLPALERMKLNAKLVRLRRDVALPELSALEVLKKEISDEQKVGLPRSYFELVEFVHPSVFGLFS